MAGAVNSSTIVFACTEDEVFTNVAVVSTEMAMEAPELTSENIHATGAIHVRVAWLLRTKKHL